MFNLKKFKNKKACVLGLGKSGRECAKLLKRQGFEVFISEGSPRPIPIELEGIECETGGHTNKVLDCDFIVKSPGISCNIPIIKKIKAKKIPLFSEIEIACAFLPKTCKLFAITGTNGKTTTTMMLGEILKAHAVNENKGRKVYILGNIGTPISSISDKVEDGSFIVLEVSSYQLESSTYFKPDVAAVLNITPDHLEHHGSLKKYVQAKENIFRDQSSKNALVINGTDKACVKMKNKAGSKVFAFSSTPQHSIKVDVFYDGDELIFSDGYRIKPPKLLMGIHNIENAMAASLMAFAAKVKPQSVQQGFDTFNSVEHRIEYFAEYKGIKCYNDSKATNVDSTVTALKALQSKNKIWVILGGRNKGAPYKPLKPYLNSFCKHAVLIGEASAKIKAELSGRFPCTEKGDIKTAVDYIFKHAQAGDILLLSPACSSFDQFKDFEDRGRQFKDIVRKYIATHTK